MLGYFIGGFIFAVSSILYAKWLTSNEAIIDMELKKANALLDSGLNHKKVLSKMFFNYCFNFFIFIVSYLFFISLYYYLK